MPLDPCEDGCLNHMIPSNTVPVAGDDPCNGAGNGYFCQGSYWLYDPTEPGADTATNGDCPRLFLRNGGDCGVYQWVEISLASLIVDTVAPTTADCCPPGTIWCVPAGTDGITVSERWISTNGCPAGTCSWCQICGFCRAEINTITRVNGLPEGVNNLINFNQIFDNRCSEATPPSITIRRAGCYHVRGTALMEYPGAQPNFNSSLLRLILLVNGVPTTLTGDVGGFSLTHVGPVTMPVQGSTHLCFAAGDVLTMATAWVTDVGGTVIDFIEGNLAVKRIP